MRRERYKGQIVVARMHKVRAQPIWHASVFLDRLVKGNWQEIPIIAPELKGQDFASEESALATALNYGRSYVDAFHAPVGYRGHQRFVVADPKAFEIGS